LEIFLYRSVPPRENFVSVSGLSKYKYAGLRRLGRLIGDFLWEKFKLKIFFKLKKNFPEPTRLLQRQVADAGDRRDRRQVGDPARLERAQRSICRYRGRQC